MEGLGTFVVAEGQAEASSWVKLSLDIKATTSAFEVPSAAILDIKAASLADTQEPSGRDLVP